MNIATLRVILEAESSPVQKALNETDRLIETWAKKPRPDVQLGVKVGAAGGRGGFGGDAAKIQAATNAKLVAGEKLHAAHIAQIQSQADVRAQARQSAHQNKLLQQQEVFDQKTTQSAARRAARQPQREAAESEAARDSVGTALSDAASIVGAGALAGLGLAVQTAADFDQALRNVNSIAQLTEPQLAKLNDSVVGLASNPNIRQGPKDLAAGLYDVYSSGFQGKQAMDVLKEAAEGASAGMTDTATSGKTLMAVLNSGIGGVKDAGAGMDILFQSVNRGVFNFEELAGSIGQVLPTASKAGISLQEIGASLAVATKSGQTASEATNDLLNLITKIANPSKEARGAFEKLGISYGFAALQAKGLPGILREIQDKTGGNGDAIKKLLPDMQAQRGALSLLKNGGKDYRAELVEMGKASDGVGAKQKALTQQNKGAGAQIEIFKKQVEVLSIQAGTILLPALNDVLKSSQSLFRWYNSLSPATRDLTVKTIAYGGAVLLVGGRIKVALGLLRDLRIAFGATAVASTALGTAGAAGQVGILTAALIKLRALAAGGISIPVALGTAAGAGAYELGRNKSDTYGIGEMLSNPGESLHRLGGRLYAGLVEGNIDNYDNNMRGGWANDRSAAINRARRVKAEQAAKWRQQNMAGPRAATPAQAAAVQSRATGADAVAKLEGAGTEAKKRASKAQTEAEHAARKHAAAMLKLDTDRLQDSVQAFDRTASSIEDRARKHIDTIGELSGTMRDFFGGFQEKLLAAGVTSDPLAPMIARFEKLLGLKGRVDEFATSQQRLLNAANGGRSRAQSRLDRLQGGDGSGVGYSGSQGTQRTADTASNAMLLQIAKSFTSGEPKLSCAFVASRMANAVGANIKPTASAGGLRQNAIKAGWQQVDPSQSQRGDLIFNRRNGGSGWHAKMAAGGGQVVNSSHRQETLYDYRPRRGDEAYRAPGFIDQSTLGPNAPRQGTPRQSTSGRDVAAINPNDSISQIAREFAGSFSKAVPVTKSWGAAVKDTDTTTARFAAQTLLASREFQGMLAKAGITGKKYQEFAREFRTASNDIDIKLNATSAKDAMTERLRVATASAVANLQAMKTELSYSQFETSMRSRGVSDANAARSLDYRKEADSLKGKDFTPEQIDSHLKAFRQKQLSEVAREEVQNYKAALKEADDAATEIRKQVAADMAEMAKGSAALNDEMWSGHFQGEEKRKADDAAQHEGYVENVQRPSDDRDAQRKAEINQYIKDVQDRLRLMAMPQGIGREVLGVRQGLERQGWKKEDIDKVEPAARQGLEFEKRLEEIRQQADQMRGVIENSLTQGFENGIGNGVKSFAKGIAEMVKQRALHELSGRITDRIFGGAYREAGGQGAMYERDGGAFDIFSRRRRDTPDAAAQANPATHYASALAKAMGGSPQLRSYGGGDVFSEMRGEPQMPSFTPGFAGPLAGSLLQKFVPDAQFFPSFGGRGGFGGSSGGNLSVASLSVGNLEVAGAQFNNAQLDGATMPNANISSRGGGSVSGTMGSGSAPSNEQILLQVLGSFAGG